MASTQEDFCANQLTPGRYHLVFAEARENALVGFLYYPGTPRRRSSIALELRAGQTVSNLLLGTPPQPAYVVKGAIEAAEPLPQGAEVVLTSAEYPLLITYRQTVSPDGRFAFPLVLGGRYWGFVHVEGNYALGEEEFWATAKFELMLDRNLENLAPKLWRSRTGAPAAADKAQSAGQ